MQPRAHQSGLHSFYQKNSEMISLTHYQQLVDLLKTKKLKIATAESCTGGWVAKKITDIPGASQIFLGGFVAYNNEMKIKWLKVKQTTLDKFGAVSRETVDEMISGVLKQTGADIGIAVSGIAGPGGGTEEKPVGTVFIGIGFRDKRVIKKFLFQGSRDRVRQRSVASILQLICELSLERT